MNNNSKELSGTPWQQMSQIITFHETRLNRLEKYTNEKEKRSNPESSSDFTDRLVGMEEHMNIVMESLQASAENVQKIGGEVSKANKASLTALDETRKVSTTARTFPTKVAVLQEKCRLLDDKVEKMSQMITALESKLAQNVTLDVNEDTEDEETE
tara:strand:- start:4636 stop:5103 length:468 start_codon:yes stop_codon:yes gene_type:complete